MNRTYLQLLRELRTTEIQLQWASYAMNIPAQGYKSEAIDELRINLQQMLLRKALMLSFEAAQYRESRKAETLQALLTMGIENVSMQDNRIYIHP